VQQAACSAFATIEEEARTRLVPYLPYILPYMAEGRRLPTLWLASFFFHFFIFSSFIQRPLLPPSLPISRCSPTLCLYIGLGRYQTRCLIVLLDTLGTLADAVKAELAKPEYFNIFMPKVHYLPNLMMDPPADRQRRRQNWKGCENARLTSCHVCLTSCNVCLTSCGRGV
jgi:hypothetical protein